MSKSIREFRTTSDIETLAKFSTKSADLQTEYMEKLIELADKYEIDRKDALLDASQCLYQMATVFDFNKYNPETKRFE